MGIGVEVEAGEVGFDAARLRRIDRHFARYVDDGRLPGWLVLVSRRGKVVHLATCGRRDLEADLPVEADTRFRVYSMTKPLTAVAAMQLYEEGAFALKDPVERFIPAFAELSVYQDGPASAPRCRHRSSFSGLEAAASTLAFRATARSTAARPTPPAEPSTTTQSPSATWAVERSA